MQISMPRFGQVSESWFIWRSNWLRLIWFARALVRCRTLPPEAVGLGGCGAEVFFRLVGGPCEEQEVFGDGNRREDEEVVAGK
jgi:hypothetical protein